MQRVRTSGTQCVNVWLVPQSLAFLRCSSHAVLVVVDTQGHDGLAFPAPQRTQPTPGRSEEHTSELQSRGHLVCRPLLEKKKSPLHRCPHMKSDKNGEDRTVDCLG